VHVRDERRGHCGLRDLRASRDDSQQPRLDERLKRVCQHRLERRMDRVQFEQGGTAMLEDLTDDIGSGEAGHVARAEHEGHAPRPRPFLGFTPPAAVEGIEPARIHAPHRGPVAAEDHRIKQGPHRHDIDFDHRGRV